MSVKHAHHPHPESEELQTRLLKLQLAFNPMLSLCNMLL